MDAECSNIFERLSNTSAGGVDGSECSAETATINTSYPNVMKKLIFNQKIQFVSKVTVQRNNDIKNCFPDAPGNHVNGLVGGVSGVDVGHSPAILENGCSPEQTSAMLNVEEDINTIANTPTMADIDVKIDDEGQANNTKDESVTENTNGEEPRNIFHTLTHIGDDGSEMQFADRIDVCDKQELTTLNMTAANDANFKENCITNQNDVPPGTISIEAEEQINGKYEHYLPPEKSLQSLEEIDIISRNNHNTIFENVLPSIERVNESVEMQPAVGMNYNAYQTSPDLTESTAIQQQQHNEISSDIIKTELTASSQTENNDILHQNIAEKVVHEHAVESTMAESENSNDSNSANLRRSNRIKLKRSDSNNKEEDDDLEEEEQTCILNRNLSSDHLFSIDPNSKGFPEFKHIYENQWYSTKKKSKSRKHTRNMVCECVTSREERRSGVAACGESCLNRLLMIECGSRCPCGDHCTNKSFQRRRYAEVEVFKTEFKGWGLRAMRQIQPGDLIMEYCGEIIDPKEFARRSTKYSVEKQQHFYFMALSQDEFIDATKKGNVSRFINHSCDPNAETQKWTVNGRLRIGFFAVKELEVGTEVTFDYQFERYGKVAQKCFCGSDKCRGYLGQAPDKDETSPMKQSKDIDTYDGTTIAWEISRYHEGLLSVDDALSLCRLMVRCDTLHERQMCLDVLLNTQMQTYLKSFMQYHGLSLIWSWMVDLPETDSNQQKLIIICTLEKLPIATKNALDDSNILPVVKRWIEDAKKVVCNNSNDSKKDEETNEEEHKEEECDEVTQDMLLRMERMVDEWKDLREVYRIPKRQIQEQKANSAASSPSRDSRHDSSPTTTSSRNRRRSSDRHHRHSHHSSSRRSPRSSSNSRRRRSPPRKRRYSNSAESSPGHSAADDWTMERSKEEHRKQFEREMKLKEQIPTIVDQRSYVETMPPQQMIQMADPTMYNNNLIQMTTMQPLAGSVTTIQQQQQLQQQQLQLQQQQMGMMAPQYLTTYAMQPTPMYSQTVLSAPNPVLQTAQQPMAAPAEQGGVTILGSQGNQAIVLLSAEQLQQLTQTGTLQPPVPASTTTTEPVKTVTNQPEPPKPSPKKTEEDKLPPNWKTAKDAEGKTYYYHAITRQTQWDRPTSSGNAMDTGGSNESEEMDISTPTHDERQSKQKVELTGEAKKVAEREKHAKDKFRLHISQFVVKCLGHYRKSTCKKGRVTSSEDFKHIARKLTHNLMEKEMKMVQNFEDLEFNANVKHKTKEYIHKYMAKVGPVYRIRDDNG